MTGVNWPLQLSFKLLTISARLTVTDAQGRVVCSVKKKKFKLREHVEVFADADQTQHLGDIKADNVLDFSGRYAFTDLNGNDLGAVGRQGMKSIFKARYDVFDAGDNKADYEISEENPMAKFFDGVLGGVPILGMFTGFFFHPRYAAVDTSGQIVMRLTKKAAFFEGKFEMERVGGELTGRQELNLILSFLMLVLLERARG